MRLTRSKGFTLVELLVVIGIVGILLAITLVAINPARQFAQANDSARTSHLNTILNAITQLKVDNRGAYPSNWTSPISAGYAAFASGSGTAWQSLCQYLTGAVGGVSYVAALPFDPKAANGGSWTSCTSFTTGYQVKEVTGRVSVMTPNGENGGAGTITIEVTR